LEVNHKSGGLAKNSVNGKKVMMCGATKIAASSEGKFS
jgi:hypothetical protein